MCNCGGSSRSVKSRSAPQKSRNFQLPLKAQTKPRATPSAPVKAQPKPRATTINGSMTGAHASILGRNVRPKNVYQK